MSLITTSLITCSTRQEAAHKVSSLIEASLIGALSSSGRANLLVSGGSTPKLMFEQLSQSDIDWSSVSVGLVDERCVPPSNQSSNARLALECLLINAAREASFVPMYRDGESPSTMASFASRAYIPLVSDSVVVLGMGADGHTASWFPNAKNLEDAYRADAPTVVAIDAEGCDGAGNITDRLTLSREAIAQCKSAVLMLFGEEKKRVFELALEKKVEEAPIRAAVEDLGERLVTVWAP